MEQTNWGKYVAINNQEYTRKLPRRKCYTLRNDTEDDLSMLTDTGLVGFGPGSCVSDVWPPELQDNKLGALASKFLVVCSSTIRKLLQDPFLPSSWMPRPQLPHYFWCTGRGNSQKELSVYDPVSNPIHTGLHWRFILLFSLQQVCFSFFNQLNLFSILRMYWWRAGW